MNELPQEEAVSQMRAIFDFISALNISRRCVGSYPKGHRAIQASLARVTDLFAKISASRPELTFGITRDAIYFQEKPLEIKNTGYRDYAKILFLHEISVLTFQEGLETEELRRFNEILSDPRERIRESGGIEQVLSEAGIRNILVKKAEYDQFQVIEKNQVKAPEEENFSDIWEKFVQRLLEGTLVSSGQSRGFESEITPETAAGLINENALKDSPEPEKMRGQCQAGLSAYVRALFGSEKHAVGRKAQLDRLSRFLRNLNPELRTHFLAGICDSLTAHKEFAEEVLSSFPEEIIQETLEKMNSPESSLPPFVLRVLQKLGKRFRPEDTPVISVMDSEAAGEFKLPKGGVWREDDHEARIPLPDDAAGEIGGAENAPDADFAELEELKRSLDARSMDLQLSTIVLEIFTSGVSPDNGESLKENLIDSCRYFLGIGDFAGLNDLHSRMLEYRLKTSAEKISPIMEVLSLFAQPDFIGEVLDGPRMWGKEKYADIHKLILSVGPPFIAPVLDHLAVEENLSVRYFFIDCLLKMGESAREPILSRLHDGRWYFVRNLVMILRKMSNPSIPTALRRLLRHPHAKVREEVLKTLLQFNDPDADRMILADLSAKEKALRLNAATLAENSQSRQIADKLLEILKKGDLFGSDMDLKKKVVQSLAKIANPEVLPELEKVLESSNFLGRHTQKELKSEIIRSFESYPGSLPLTLLEKLSQYRDGELALMAAHTLKNMRRRTPL